MLSIARTRLKQRSRPARIVATCGAFLLAVAVPAWSLAAPAAAAASDVSQGISVSRNNFGVNTFAWDSQITTPGAATALEQLGVGMQQFPNSVNWDWETNTAVANAQDPVNPGGSPESLSDWGKLLQQTGQTGLYIFDYDEAPGWTGGGTAADATQLSQYIATNHIPVSAIVIGDEEYGQWDFVHNLHKNKSALAYATNAAKIAQAIRAVLPNVKIGVSFEDGTSAHALRWDQDVLRLDAPYINFLSVHSYPMQSTASASQLLQGLPTIIQQLIQTANQQISANVSPVEAEHISVWVTEWNPEGLPGALSLTPAYGAAMVESLAAWRSAGAGRVVVWSFDGGADAQGNDGTFALVANGSLGSEAENQLYPSGEAVAAFMNAIGSGGTLKSWQGPTGFAAVVTQTDGSGTSFFINTTSEAQSYTYNGTDSVEVPADSMEQVNTAAASVAGMANYPPVQPAIGEALPAPTIESVPSQVYAGETVTLYGQNLGDGGYVHLSQGALLWGTSTPNTVSWSSPGNWYTVRTLSWSPDSVTFQVPNNAGAPDGKYYGAPTPGQPLDVAVVTNSQLITSLAQTNVGTAPQPTFSGMPGSVTPGESVTLTGTNLGSAAQGGYVQIQQNGTSWGAPGNWYHVAISNWTDNSITFAIPNGQDGSDQPLQAGTATLVVNNGVTGQTSPLTFSVAAAAPTGTSGSGGASGSTGGSGSTSGSDSSGSGGAQPVLSGAPATVYPGEWVTLTGTDLGSQAAGGYLQIKQGGTSWGAPGNWYHVNITSWTSDSITFQVPNGQDGSDQPLVGGTATIQVGLAGSESQPVSISVNPYGAAITSESTTTPAQGQLVTVQGGNFGSSQGYVQLQQGNVSWGAPGNAYGVKIVSWSPTSVTFAIPNGSNASGPAIGVGAISVKVVTADGVSAAPIAMTVTSTAS